MDYTPVNIATQGRQQGQYWQTTLGTYDYWAIEYAYKPLAASSPEVKYASPREAFTMADMFEGVQDAVWSELRPGAAGQINSFRRAVQREHLKRLANLVLRPNPTTPEDAATLACYNLTQLRGRIQQALGNGAAMNTTTRAHLQESAARIDETLRAQQQRMVN